MTTSSPSITFDKDGSAPLAVRLVEKSWLIIPALGLLIAAVGFSRSYPGFGVETDFIGMFVPEAERILAGEFPQTDYHPPLYAVVLNATFLLIGDWFAAGLVVSLLSSVAAMSCAFLFIRRLLGLPAAAGSLIGFAASGPFMIFSASASSDVFFLALFLASLLAGLVALERPTWSRWTLCGVVVGLALLTRSNGLTLVLLIGLPLLLLPGPVGRRLLFAAVCAAGTASVVLSWMALAQSAGVAAFPRGNAANLALTYFSSGDRMSAEAMAEVRGKFDSVLDVMMHDPLRIALTYAKDGLALLRSGLVQLLAPPLSLFIGAALIILPVVRRDGVMLAFMAIILAQAALINFKAFDVRFYLFLVPLLGAGLFLFVRLLMKALCPARLRPAVIGVCALAGLSGVAVAVAEAVHTTREDAAELGQAVAAVEDQVPPQATIIARKPQLAFLSGARLGLFPDSDSPARLVNDLAALADAGPVYLYYGSHERLRRPRLIRLADPEQAPDALVPVARGPAAGGWVLYRYAGSPGAQ